MSIQRSSNLGAKILTPRKAVTTTGQILDLYCVRLLNAAPFWKTYAKLYFDAKEGLNRDGGRGGRGELFGAPFS